DRRTLVAHLVRADIPARLQPGAQLRRFVDRMGQPGPRPDRETIAEDAWTATHGSPGWCSTRSGRAIPLPFPMRTFPCREATRGAATCSPPISRPPRRTTTLPP